MGYLISDNTKIDNDKFNRLVKQTPTHMIVITYPIRRRFFAVPLNAEDTHAKQVEQLESLSFSGFLKKHNMMP